MIIVNFVTVDDSMINIIGSQLLIRGPQVLVVYHILEVVLQIDK